MSFFKYYREGNDDDGERLWWPGGPQGFPFRGPVPPLLKDEEYQQLRPTMKFRSQLFYLSKPEDVQRYQLISDKCANGLYVRVDRDRTWDEETKNYRIYLEWVEPAYEMPVDTEAKDAIKELVNTPQGRLYGYKNGGSSAW